MSTRTWAYRQTADKGYHAAMPQMGRLLTLAAQYSGGALFAGPLRRS